MKTKVCPTNSSKSTHVSHYSQLHYFVSLVIDLPDAISMLLFLLSNILIVMGINNFVVNGMKFKSEF